MDSSGTRWARVCTHVAALDAVGLDHDVRALGLEPAGEDGEVSARASPGGDGLVGPERHGVRHGAHGEAGGGVGLGGGRREGGGGGGALGLDGRARGGDDAGGGGGDGEGHRLSCCVWCAVEVVGGGESSRLRSGREKCKPDPKTAGNWEL